jgi:hypothetical protein
MEGPAPLQDGQKIRAYMAWLYTTLFSLESAMGRDTCGSTDEKRGPHHISMAMGLVLFVHTAATFVAGFVAGRLVSRRRGGGAAAAALEASSGGKRALSTLRQAGRTVSVVTTAALPWRTGAGGRASNAAGRSGRRGGRR